MTIRFPLTLTQDDNDTLLVTCPDLPEVTSWGDDEASALAMGTLAVAEAIAGRLNHFEDIPRPREGTHAVPLDLQMTMKVLLVWALRDEGMTRADLVRVMKEHRPQIDRLFAPNHASRLDRYEAAFRALGRRIDVAVTPLAEAA